MKNGWLTGTFYKFQKEMGAMRVEFYLATKGHTSRQKKEYSKRKYYYLQNAL